MSNVKRLELLRTRVTPRLSRHLRAEHRESELKALRGCEELPRRNGTTVLPMQHHAHPRTKRSRFVKEE